jgi:hypothetical protein
VVEVAVPEWSRDDVPPPPPPPKQTPLGGMPGGGCTS